MTEFLSRALKIIQDPRIEEQWRREIESNNGGEVVEAIKQIQEISKVSWMQEISGGGDSDDKTPEKAISKLKTNITENSNTDLQIAVKKAQTPDFDAF